MGERCLLIEFGSTADRQANDRVNALADYLLAHLPAGVVDIVPAFCVLALHYRPEMMERGPGKPLPCEQLSASIGAVLSTQDLSARRSSRKVEIPLCYGGEFGPDLAEVAARCALSEKEVIARHQSSEHVVSMLGFAPGHPYISGLDASLALPRRATPRTSVPAGTLAIANAQSVIYSVESPGGWNLIGRTPLVLFDAHREPPCLLQPGDVLQFILVSPAEFASALEQRP